MSCALFLRSWLPCPLKNYCQATQESRGRLWHHSHCLPTITPQCVCLCVCGRFCSRRMSTPLFYHIFLRGNMLTFSSFTLGLSISKTAVLEIKYSNKYWKRAVGTPILAHCSLGKWAYVLLIQLGAFDLKRRFWKASAQIITLLRVIPTMTSIRFVTGESSGILSGISSGILSGISSGILSGISSGISSDILSGILSANLLAYVLANILALYLAHLLAFYLAYLMAFYLAYLLAFYLTFYLAYLLAFYLAVEVQRCTLSWAGPRLRSSGAHWPRLRSSGAHGAGKVPGWGPAVHTELGSWQRAWRRAWRRVGKAEVQVEVDADMVEEKLEEEDEEEDEEDEEEDS